MGNFMKAVAVIVALALVAAWSVWAGDQINQEAAVEITGTLLEGRRLQDDQGRKWILAQDEETLQLMSHVGAKVQIKGALIAHPEDQQIIKIKSYQVIRP